MKYLFFAFLIACGFTACETTESPGPLINAPAQTSSTTPAPKPAPSGVKPYPRSTCLVTGEKLNAKGTPMSFVHQGQEVKVCCVACQMAFKMSPETYMARIR